MHVSTVVHISSHPHMHTNPPTNPHTFTSTHPHSHPPPPTHTHTHTHTTQSIPGVATAPVLVLVGAMMMGESKHIDWAHMNVAVPAFLTMVIQPFTFSIANGIYAGLLFSVLLFFLTGEFIPFFKSVFGMTKPGEEDDLEATLLGGPLASPGGLSTDSRGISRSVSVVGAIQSASRLLSHNAPYVKTYDMLLNTKGEPMPAEVCLGGVWGGGC